MLTRENRTSIRQHFQESGGILSRKALKRLLNSDQPTLMEEHPNLISQRFDQNIQFLLVKAYKTTSELDQGLN